MPQNTILIIKALILFPNAFWVVFPKSWNADERGPSFEVAVPIAPGLWRLYMVYMFETKTLEFKFSNTICHSHSYLYARLYGLVKRSFLTCSDVKEAVQQQRIQTLCRVFRSLQETSAARRTGRDSWRQVGCTQLWGFKSFFQGFV